MTEDTKETAAVADAVKKVEEVSAQPKKSWVYVLLGCLGLFVIVLILLAVLAFVGWRKVQKELPNLEREFQQQLEQELENDDVLQDDFLNSIKENDGSEEAASSEVRPL